MCSTSVMAFAWVGYIFTVLTALVVIWAILAGIIEATKD